MLIKDTIVARKKDFPLQQLSHNAPHWPNINCKRDTRSLVIQLRVGLLASGDRDVRKLHKKDCSLRASDHSDCSASSSAWSQEPDTSVSPHSLSSRHPSVWPIQSQGSRRQEESFFFLHECNFNVGVKHLRLYNWPLTLSSQSSFTATLLGLRSWET